MKYLKSIEGSLAPLFKKPDMLKGGKEWFVKYLSILAFNRWSIASVGYSSVMALWNVADNIVDSANELSRSLGGQVVDRPFALWF